VAFIPKKKNQPDLIQNPKACGRLSQINLGANPEAEHTVHLNGSGSIRSVPCEKTEDEIERQYAYNKIMGRQT